MAAALPQLIDRFPDLEDELPWHLTASAWGEDDRNLPGADPAIEGGLTHPEDQSGARASESRAKSGLQITTNRRYLTGHRGYTFGTTQTNDVLGQLFGLSDARHEGQFRQC